MPQAHGFARHGVESGIGPELEITADRLNHAIDSAIEAGAEVFFNRRQLVRRSQFQLVEDCRRLGRQS